jgi:hypothetical protein
MSNNIQVVSRPLAAHLPSSILSGALCSRKSLESKNVALTQAESKLKLPETGESKGGRDGQRLIPGH